MKLYSKIAVASALACCVSAQAQLLEGYQVKKEHKVSVEKQEKRDRADSKVRKFIENQKNAPKVIRKVASKSDILGRKGKDKNLNGRDSVAYIDNPSSRAKMRVLVGKLTSDVPAANGYVDDVRYDAESKKMIYSLNGREVSQSVYEKKVGEWRKKHTKEAANHASPVVQELTADEIEAKLASSEDVYVAEVKEHESFAYQTVVDTFGVRQNLVTTDVIFDLNKIRQYAHQKNYKGQKVGVYFSDLGCAKKSALGSYYHDLGCATRDSLHATGVAKVLHETAPSASLYDYDYVYGVSTGDNLYPDNPKAKGIQIGSHSIGYVDEGFYNLEDALLDEYSYFNLTTEFVSAGNLQYGTTLRKVASPGKAVNAITVGAIQPSITTSSVGGYSYMHYSQYGDSELENAKPEIANFTNFLFPNDNYVHSFTGTSASTPYSAGMAALLMSQDSAKYRDNPEKVKAAFLAAGSIKPKNADDFDYDNAYYTARIPMYHMFTKERMHTAGCHEVAESACMSNNGEYIQEEKNIVKGKRYRVAISWLSSAYHVFNNKKLPQDYDMYVTLNGKWIAGSNSSDNPFEVIEFTAKENGTLKAHVLSYRNDLPQYPVYLGYSFVRVNE